MCSPTHRSVSALCIASRKDTSQTRPLDRRDMCMCTPGAWLCLYRWEWGLGALGGASPGASDRRLGLIVDVYRNVPRDFPREARNCRRLRRSAHVRCTSHRNLRVFMNVKVNKPR
eukprot:3465992-Heterocapsa_arctica.AAC.1